MLKMLLAIYSSILFYSFPPTNEKCKNLTKMFTQHIDLNWQSCAVHVVMVSLTAGGVPLVPLEKLYEQQLACTSMPHLHAFYQNSFVRKANHIRTVYT